MSEGIAAIIRTMDKVSLKNQRGYEILIQTLALKIFDEKRSQKNKEQYLEFYKTEEEHNAIDLKFYVTPQELNYTDLSDDNVISFVDRMRALYNESVSRIYLYRRLH